MQAQPRGWRACQGLPEGWQNQVPPSRWFISSQTLWGRHIHVWTPQWRVCSLQRDPMLHCGFLSESSNLTSSWVKIFSFQTVWIPHIPLNWFCPASPTLPIPQLLLYSARVGNSSQHSFSKYHWAPPVDQAHRLSLGMQWWSPVHQSWWSRGGWWNLPNSTEAKSWAKMGLVQRLKLSKAIYCSWKVAFITNILNRTVCSPSREPTPLYKDKGSRVLCL